jgi:hypothetical protein
MAEQLVTLDEIKKMFTGKQGVCTIEVADVEYKSLLEDATLEGMVVMEMEEGFSILSDGLTIKIQHS